jgi:hypothetical protein
LISIWRDRKTFKAAALLIVVFFAKGAASAGTDATLTGTVRAAAPVIPPSSSKSDSYGNRQAHYATRFDFKHLKNVVVSAEPASTPKVAGPSVRLKVYAGSRGLRADAAFLIWPAGRDLALENSSRGAITLYAAGDSAGELTVQVPAGQTRTVPSPARGLYHLRCQEDPGLEVRVVAAGPYAAALDAAGTYTLHLPPGRYRVTAWHERLPEQEQDAEVASGQTLKLDFNLSVSQLPEVH